MKVRHSKHRNSNNYDLLDRQLMGVVTEKMLEKKNRNLDSGSIVTDSKEDNLKAKIDKTQRNSKYGMHRKAEENKKHVICKLVQKKCEQSHDWFRTYPMEDLQEVWNNMEIKVIWVQAGDSN